ncbi:hypothetical protein DV737_g3610, partial [Chaetothyriales sp. CBS 132003]
MAGVEPATPLAGHQDTHHEEDEWNRQRENFTQYYMTEKKTLKAARELMIAKHNFLATPRQWERRIKDWGLQKYASRQARMDEIQQQGRSIEDVAEPGRRSATHLQPNDDRNLRRFARREITRSVSRSRSRSRSQSFGRHSRSTTPISGTLRKTSAPELLRVEDFHGLSLFSTDQLNAYVTCEPTTMPEAANTMNQSSHMLEDAHAMPAQINDSDGVNDLYLAVPSENQSPLIPSVGNALQNPLYGYALQGGPMPSETTPFPSIELVDGDIAPLDEDSMSTSQASFVSALNEPWDMLEHSQGGGVPSHDFPPHSDPLTSPNGYRSGMENISITPHPESIQNSPTAGEFDSLQEFTYPPALSPHLGPTDPNIYNNSYSSVLCHTQLMYDDVIHVLTQLDASEDVLKSLQNKLDSHRANLVSELTRHLNRFAKAKEEAVQALESDLDALRRKMSQDLRANRSLLHSTVELLGARLIPALECAERITAIVEALSAASSHHTIRVINFDLSQIDKQAELPDDSLPPASEPKDIYARVGYYAFDMSSGINAHSYQAILGSANLALEGVKLLVGGYCYVNNAAVAVAAYRHLLHPSPSPSPSAQSPTQTARTAILDLDFHHGNGTQSIFYHDPSVLYVSIHGRDEFPYYTGSASETGAGAGAGFNVNLPLDTGSSYAEYARLLDAAIARIREHGPRFLVLSLGFDTFELDPLGKFAIGTADYESMARTLRRGVMMKTEEGDEAEAGGPVEKALILLEGGYVVDRLGENMLSFLKGWEEEDG